MNMMTRVTAADPARETWELALADYRAKLEASDAIPDGAPGEDVALEQYCVAQDHLLADVPAPTPQELALKIEMAVERAKDFVPLIFPDHAEGIAADFSRLTGIDPLRHVAKAWLDRWQALGGDFGTSCAADGSARHRVRGIPEPSFFSPPAEQNPRLRPHEWIVDKADHRGAVKMLESFLTLVPGLKDAVFRLAAS